VVKGTNTTYVKLNGIKSQEYGIDVYKKIYAETLKGDWDGDTVQLLAMGNSIIKNMFKNMQGDDITRAMEKDIYENVRRDLSVKVSAGVKSPGGLGIDTVQVGQLLDQQQSIEQFMQMIDSYFRRTILDNDTMEEILKSARLAYREADVKTQTISTKSGEIGTESLLFKVADDKNNFVQYSSKHTYSNSSDEFVLFETQGGLDGAKRVIGSLGSNKNSYATDPTNQNIEINTKFEHKSELDHTINKGTTNERNYRVFRMGDNSFAIMEESVVSPGVFKFIGTSKNIVSKDKTAIIVKNYINNNNTGDYISKSHSNLFNGKYATSAVALSGALDAISTSRVKFESLGWISENKLNDALYNDFLMQMSSAYGIRIGTITNDSSESECFIGTKLVDKTTLESASHMVNRAHSIMNTKMNQFISLSEYRDIIKLLKSTQPKDEVRDKVLATTSRLLANYSTFHEHLNGSLKSILGPLYKVNEGKTPIAKAYEKYGKYLEPEAINYGNDRTAIENQTVNSIKKLSIAKIVYDFIDNTYYDLNNSDISGFSSLITNLGLLQRNMNTEILHRNHDINDLFSDIADRASALANGNITKALTKEDVQEFFTRSGFYVKTVHNKGISTSDAVMAQSVNNQMNNSSSYNTFGVFKSGEESTRVRVEDMLKSFSAQYINKTDENIGALAKAAVDKAIINAISGVTSLHNQKVISNYTNGLSSDLIQAIGSGTKEKPFKVTDKVVEKFNKLTHIFSEQEVSPLVNKNIARC
jgi:hypothetical protein